MRQRESETETVRGEEREKCYFIISTQNAVKLRRECVLRALFTSYRVRESAIYVRQ